MTDHLHSEFVAGCYRCELNRDEDPSDLDVALDALEGMVEQYLHEGPPGEYDHSCMWAGEEATEVLVRLRPDRWEHAARGLKRKETP